MSSTPAQASTGNGDAATTAQTPSTHPSSVATPSSAAVPSAAAIPTAAHHPQISATNILFSHQPSFVDPSMGNPQHSTKYAQLLAVIEDLGKDVRPAYATSKTASERLKKNIQVARNLVRECIVEVDRAVRK